jgi:hypothetical protein
VSSIMWPQIIRTRDCQAYGEMMRMLRLHQEPRERMRWLYNEWKEV